jgi:hypothetical protein
LVSENDPSAFTVAAIDVPLIFTVRPTDIGLSIPSELAALPPLMVPEMLAPVAGPADGPLVCAGCPDEGVALGDAGDVGELLFPHAMTEIERAANAVRPNAA